MRTKRYSYSSTGAAKDAPRIKTVGLQFGVSDGDLEAKVKAAFDLAKSGGRELDLTFSSGDPRPSQAGPLPSA